MRNHFFRTVRLLAGSLTSSASGMTGGWLSSSPGSSTLRRLAAITLLCGLCTGCPELNRWSGPNHDPFFSVDDEPAASTDPARRGKPAGKPVRQEDPSADLGSWEPALSSADRTAVE